jgi:hypothetical protein
MLGTADPLASRRGDAAAPPTGPASLRCPSGRASMLRAGDGDKGGVAGRFPRRVRAGFPAATDSAPTRRQRRQLRLPCAVLVLCGEQGIPLGPA